MMKRILICLFFYLGAWCMSASLHAQTQVLLDSLRQQLQVHPQPDTSRVIILKALASQLRNSGTSEALAYAKEALAIAEQLHDPRHRGSTLQILGIIYLTRTDYKTSLFYSLQALRVYETLNDAEGKAYAYNAMGLVYSRLKKTDLAEKYYLEGIRELKEHGREQQLSTFYNNLANVLNDEQRKAESVQYYKMALAHAMQNNKRAVARVYVNIGDVYYDLGQLDSARLYLQKGLKSSAANADNYATASCYFELAKVELKDHHIQLADQFLVKAKNMAEAGSMKDLLQDIYELSISVYKEKGDAEKVYTYALKSSAMRDSIFNETTVKQLNDMQEAYQVEKRDKEIRLLNQEQEIMEANSRNQQLVRNFAIAALLLLLATGVVIGRNMVLKQRVKNKVLSEKNAIAEKDIVKLNHENILAKYEAMKSKTDPHFLFNSLTTLSSLVMEDPALAVKYIKQFSELFRMVLEISDHKVVTLEKELEVVNSYIYLQQVRFGDHLSTDIRLPEHVSQIFIPPFALQMVIENAVKHNIISQRYPFVLSVYTEDQYIVISNTLQKKNSRVPSTSTGHKSVKERYKILCDTPPLFIETSTQYIVKLPLLRKEDVFIFKEEALTL